MTFATFRNSCPRSETLNFSIRYPTRILPFRVISILAYHRVPLRTTSKKEGFEFWTQVLELVVNDSRALACYRVTECAVGDPPDNLLMLPRVLKIESRERFTFSGSVLFVGPTCKFDLVVEVMWSQINA